MLVEFSHLLDIVLFLHDVFPYRGAYGRNTHSFENIKGAYLDSNHEYYDRRPPVTKSVVLAMGIGLYFKATATL